MADRALSDRPISDGLRPKSGTLTDAQALVERLEAAAQPGHSPSERRRVLREAAAFISASLNERPNRSSEAA